jgi:hypothetical protein
VTNLSADEAMKRIRAAIEAGTLEEPFRPSDLNRALGIDWGGRFLVNHCQDTGTLAPQFIRVGAGIYRLKHELSSNPKGSD